MRDTATEWEDAMKIGIYGTKKRGLAEMKKCQAAGHEVCFIETHPEQREVEGVPVYAAADAKTLGMDEYHIANTHIEETVRSLLDAGVEEERIVVLMPMVGGDANFVLRYLDSTYYQPRLSFDAGLVLTRTMSYQTGVPYVDPLQIGHNRLFFSDDYSRYGTLRLLVREIEENQIPGDAAELGVFQGKFSYAINSLLPQRKLWLFDTFEGFAEENITDEEKEIGIAQGTFGETSEQKVLSRLPHPEMGEVRKGLSPSTIPAQDVKLAFVSIDCDLYQPALDGLQYFYPRLQPGGYIMLHDYINTYFPGIHKAVEDYEKSHGRLVKVPLADEAGTVVIQKP